MATKKIATSTSSLKAQLMSHEEQLQEYLGAGVDVRHYIGGIVEEFDRNHALKSCDIASIFQAVRKAALAGLPLGQDLCYLVPYAGKCQFQMGYRGLLHLARESGAILRHVVRSVHQGDLIDYDDGLRPWVKVTAAALQRDYTNMTHVYAHFALPHNQEHLEVMTHDAVEQHRAQYTKASGNDSPWQTNPLAMAKKTVIRRAFAGDQIPLSAKVRTIVVSDQLNEVIGGSVVDENDAVIQQIQQQGMTEAGLSTAEQDDIRQQELGLEGTHQPGD